MEDYNKLIAETSIWVSLVALVVGIVVFIFVWIIGGIVFNLFDSLRGLGDDKLQAIFRELFVPGIGGYFAMVSTKLWFERANIKFVFFGFSAIILVTVGVYIGFVGPVATQIGVDMGRLLLSILSIVSASVGAYIYAKNEI